MPKQLQVKLTQWSYAKRSDGTYVVSGKTTTKMFFNTDDYLELYTVISPKDKGEYILFDLPGSYQVRCYKADKKKRIEL